MTTETDNNENRFPEYEFHPLAEIFPLMSDDELRQLAKDISKNGLLEPIVLFEGKILDGRNRYKACRMINKKSKFEEFNEKLDPLDYVISLNLHRRHLNSAQKAELGLVILEKERKIGRKKQLRGLKSFQGINAIKEKIESPHQSMKIAAAQVCISDKTLWQWEKITDSAREDEEIEIARVKALQGQKSIVSIIRHINLKEKGLRKRKTIPKSLRHEIFKRDNYQCVECGATNNEIVLEIDHILPIKQGGTDELSNLQTLCEKCNLAKSDRKWIGNNSNETKLLCEKCTRLIEEGDLFYFIIIQLNQLHLGNFCKITKSVFRYYHKECYLIIGGEE